MRLWPIAADRTRRLIVGWQTAREEHSRDLAARASGVNELRQRLAISVAAESRVNLPKAEVQQQPALRDSPSSKALSDGQSHQCTQVHVRRDVLLAQAHQRIATHAVTVIREQAVA